MKKAISLIIALCLIFCSVVPSFAATDVIVQGFYNPSTGGIINAGSTMSSIVGYLVQLTRLSDVDPSGNTVFHSILNTLSHIESWLVPVGSSGTNPSLYQLMLEAGIALQSYLPYIPTISSYVSSWMTSNNNYLNDLNVIFKNGRYIWNDALTNWTYNYAIQDSSMDLWGGSTSGVRSDSRYWIPVVRKGSLPLTDTNLRWVNGTPLGNVAAILQKIAANQAYSYAYNFDDSLEGFDDQLTTWDSQGNVLSQVLFTPKSAINGLYRYLAFTQRDVARLTYVFASDQELLAREQQQAVTDAVTDIFLDSNIGSSTNVGDIDRLGRFSEIANDNFDTGYGLSNISSIFDDNQYINNDGWFTITTANNLGYYPQTRELSKSLNDDNLDYPTPLLDNYYNEILSLAGDKK